MPGSFHTPGVVEWLVEGVSKNGAVALEAHFELCSDYEIRCIGEEVTEYQEFRVLTDLTSFIPGMALIRHP